MLLTTLGGRQLTNLTGCLPPCEYDAFEVIKQETRIPKDIFFMQANATFISLGLTSTNVKVVREVALYDWESLLGEVGGYMGMFLGASLVSLYQVTVDAVNRGIIKKST